MTQRQDPRGGRVRVDRAQARDSRAEWEPVPGLLPRWEIPSVVAPSMEFYMEEHGTHAGVELFKVYRRRQAAASDVGIAVALSLAGELAPIHARLLPIDDGESPVAALIIEPGQRAALARFREQLARQAPAPRALPKGDAGSMPVGAAAPRTGGRR